MQAQSQPEVYKHSRRVGRTFAGGWPSRTLTRHGIPHPWQFHGWAAANSPWQVHRSQRNRRVPLVSFRCRQTCTATTALDTRTLSSDFVILLAHRVLSLYQVSAHQVPFGKLRACPELVEGAGSHRAWGAVRNEKELSGDLSGRRRPGPGGASHPQNLLIPSASRPTRETATGGASSRQQVPRVSLRSRVGMTKGLLTPTIALSKLSIPHSVSLHRPLSSRPVWPLVSDESFLAAGIRGRRRPRHIHSQKEVPS